MHDAYEPVPILEKLPLQIDCLAAWGEFCFPSYVTLHVQHALLLTPFHSLIMTISKTCDILYLLHVWQFSNMDRIVEYLLIKLPFSGYVSKPDELSFLLNKKLVS